MTFVRRYYKSTSCNTKSQNKDYYVHQDQVNRINNIHKVTYF